MIRFGPIVEIAPDLELVNLSELSSCTACGLYILSTSSQTPDIINHQHLFQHKSF